MGELVHLRLEKKMKLRINEIVKLGLFSNMTEFIRDAIRKRIEEHEKRKAIEGLRKLKGSAKPLTKEEQKKAKAELVKMTPSELFRKLGLD